MIFFLGGGEGQFQTFWGCSSVHLLELSMSWILDLCSLPEKIVPWTMWLPCTAFLCNLLFILLPAVPANCKHMFPRWQPPLPILPPPFKWLFHPALKTKVPSVAQSFPKVMQSKIPWQAGWGAEREEGGDEREGHTTAGQAE